MPHTSLEANDRKGVLPKRLPSSQFWIGISGTRVSFYDKRWPALGYCVFVHSGRRTDPVASRRISEHIDKLTYMHLYFHI
jgi:hypothetical protein